jgi:hypothetical protein
VGVSERFVSIDPWASERPRQRDWMLLLSGALAVVLAAASLALPPTTATIVKRETLSAERMQEIEAQTRLLNEQIARLEQPWPALLRAILLDLPPGTGVLQFDIDTQQGRIKLVLDTDDFAAVEVAIARLERSGLFTGLRASGHDRDAEGRLRALVEGRLVASDSGASGAMLPDEVGTP